MKITLEKLVTVLTSEADAFKVELDNAMSQDDSDAVTLTMEEIEKWRTKLENLSLTNSRPVQSLSRRMATLASVAAQWLATQTEPELEPKPEPETAPTPEASLTTPLTNQSERPDLSEPAKETEPPQEPTPEPTPKTATDDPVQKPDESAPKPESKTSAFRKL